MFNDVSIQASINAPPIRLTSATTGTVSQLPNDGRYFARPTAITLVALSQNTGQIADLRARADLAQAQIDLAVRQLADTASAIKDNECQSAEAGIGPAGHRTGARHHPRGDRRRSPIVARDPRLSARCENARGSRG